MREIMFYRFLLVFLILIHSNQIKSNDIDTFQHCLIHNLKYSHEYLYASKKKHATYNIWTTLLSKVDDFNKITWIFIPVNVEFLQMDPMMNTTHYLIKNGKYENQYLCASNQLQKMSLDDRLLIKLSTIKHFDQFHNYDCYWTFEKVYVKKTIDGFKESESAFMIKNMLVNEPMYAASMFFNTGWYKRSVFLYLPKKSIILEKCLWNIDCSKGEYLFMK
jgi:hypothetical protein